MDGRECIPLWRNALIGLMFTSVYHHRSRAHQRHHPRQPTEPTLLQAYPNYLAPIIDVWLGTQVDFFFGLTQSTFDSMICGAAHTLTSF